MFKHPSLDGCLFIPKSKEEKLNKQYIYPQNMRASATLWLWSLKDFAIIVVGALFSAMVLATTRILIPAVLTAAFAFLSIRNDETTILDFLKYAVRYFISTQQYFEWGLKNKPVIKQKKEVRNDSAVNSHTNANVKANILPASSDKKVGE